MNDIHGIFTNFDSISADCTPGKLDKRNNSHKKPKSNDVIIKAQKAGGSTLPFGAFGGDDKRRGGRSYDRQGRATRGRMDDGDCNFMFQGANPFEQFFR